MMISYLFPLEDREITIVFKGTRELLDANAKEIDKIGLQFSLHNPIDEERNLLIPFKNKYSIREIRDRGQLFYQETGRGL